MKMIEPVKTLQHKNSVSSYSSHFIVEWNRFGFVSYPKTIHCWQLEKDGIKDSKISLFKFGTPKHINVLLN